MKNRPELEDLIAAARRTLADQKRQQELSSLIDQWKAAEKPISNKRHILWTTMGVAASIILIVSIGVRLLSNSDTPQPSPIVAETQPIRTVALPTDTTNDCTTDSPRKALAVTTPIVTSGSSDAMLADNTPSMEEPIQSANETTYDEPALLASTDDTICSTLADDTKTETHIYQRTSNRLVGNARPQSGDKSRTNDDTPQLAFINCSGTSTTIEIGSIKF